MIKTQTSQSSVWRQLTYFLSLALECHYYSEKTFTYKNCLEYIHNMTSTITQHDSDILFREWSLFIPMKGNGGFIPFSHRKFVLGPTLILNKVHSKTLIPSVTY